jgi:hypothetical protein
MKNEKRKGFFRQGINLNKKGGDNMTTEESFSRSMFHQAD